MKIGRINMKKKIGVSTYIQRINTLERRLYTDGLKSIKAVITILYL
jgi:hypothetical protein